MTRWALLIGALGAVGALAITTLAGAASTAAPGATTGPVSSVMGTSATVGGSVDPGGEATTWYVEYGTTTSYGTKTASKSAGSGTASVAVSAELTGLSPATTYHYRVTATNASGTAHGADGVVTTISAPGVSTSAADEIGPFKAKLHGTVDPNGLATTWYFEYGKTTSYGSKTPSQSAGSGTAPQSVAVLVQGLSAGVTYHFRLVATSGAGTSRSGDRSFVTDAPPSVKTGVADSITPTTARLSGTVNPHGRSTSAWFEYGTSTSYGSKTPVQPVGYGSADATFTAVVAGLRSATRYHFRIAAKSDAGTVYGSDASFETTSAPTVAARPATSVGADRATLNADVNPQGRRTSWYFEYGTTTAYGTRTSSQNAGGGVNTLTVSVQVLGLRPATTYHYRVVAVSSGGTTRGPDTSFTTVGPPSAQTGPVTRLSTSTAVVSGKVNALGLAATYWVEYGRTSAYGLRTSTGSLQAGTGEVTVSFPLSGLVPGVRYHYRLVAQTVAGTTVGSDASFGTSPLPRGPNGRPVACTIVGTVSPDTLRGTPGPDVICGLGGGDVIRGLGGNDVVYGGPGDDVLDGGAGNDAVYGGLGDDRLVGGPGRDHLDGGAGRDVVLAGPGRDTIVSRDGQRDVVNGGPGRDRGRVDRRRDRRVSIELLLR